MEQGIAANRLSTRGFGKTRPIANSYTEAGRAQNRRSEIIIVRSRSHTGLYLVTVVGKAA